MGTTAEKLSYLNGTKNVLKTNLINKSVTLTGNETFRELTNKVNDIQTGGGKASPEFVSFSNYTGTSLDLSWLDTSNMTDMTNMFKYCENLITINLSGFNTSNVKDMFGMFSYCSSLTSLDVSTFDTSKVTNMSYMFYSLNYGTQSLELSNFNTTNVTNMSFMFAYCQGIKTLNISNFNTSKVTNMESMFYYCIGLKSLDVSNFDTSNVTNMKDMFSSLNVTSLDVSNFNTSNVTNMSGMFGYNKNLISLDISNFDTSNVTSIHSMFRLDSKLKNIKGILDLQSFDGSGWGYFESCSALEEVHIHNLGANLSLSDSPNLTHDCLVELINNLQTVTSTKTLTLGSTNLAKLSDAEKQVATDKGWTLA